VGFVGNQVGSRFIFHFELDVVRAFLDDLNLRFHGLSQSNSRFG